MVTANAIHSEIQNASSGTFGLSHGEYWDVNQPLSPTLNTGGHYDFKRMETPLDEAADFDI